MTDEPIATALERSLRSVTRSWTEAKRHADREHRVRQRTLEELLRSRARPISIKDAAWRVMEQAYLKASTGGTLPANARQVMYAARPLILALTGGRIWKPTNRAM